MAIRGYHLGCPAWGLPAWRGSLFRRDDEASALAQYASVFNTVEGNTTFYALPSDETVARWAEQSPDGFRFCFKFPRTISHDLQLEGAEAATDQFLDLLAPLSGKLGPLMLQLPPSFGPQRLDRLAAFLDRLPSQHDYAVEVRHEGLFDGGKAETRLERLLRDRGMEWVTLDTRGLFTASREDRHVVAAQSRKPHLPVRARALGPHPMVRFVPHPDFAQNLRLLDGWRAAIRSWLDAGRKPYFFMHAPHDRDAPELARRFHVYLRDAGLVVGRMPAWPGETLVDDDQLGLF